MWNTLTVPLDCTLGQFNTVHILTISFSMIHLHILGPTLPVPLFIWFPSVNSHPSPSLHACTPHASLLKHPHNTKNMVWTIFVQVSLFPYSCISLSTTPSPEHTVFKYMLLPPSKWPILYPYRTNDKLINFFFIVAPCILIFTQFIHKQMHIY